MRVKSSKIAYFKPLFILTYGLFGVQILFSAPENRWF